MKNKYRIVILASLLFSIFTPAASRAAVEMILKIQGIEGESQTAGHTNEIDVLAWSWGMSNAGSFHVGGAGGGGKAYFQDLSITKYVDKSTPSLMGALSTGDTVPAATLIVRKAGGTGLEYIRITMTKILVTSLSTGGSSGEDRLTENISLNFAQVKVEYIPQIDDIATGPLVEFGFDIEKNIKL